MARKPDSVQESASRVIGVIPMHLLDLEVGKTDLTRFVVTVRDRVQFVPIDQVMYLKSSANYVEIFTPGDACDILVAMNAAGLKSSLDKVKKQGTVLINIAGFDKKNLNLAKSESNPLEDGTLDDYRVIEMDISKLTQETLKDSGLGRKDVDRSKNMFVLGFLYWMFNRDMSGTEKFLKSKFGRKPEILEANLKVLKAGYHYGDTTETFTTRYDIKKADLPTQCCSTS